MDKWYLIQEQPKLRVIFKEPPLISHRKGKSVKDMLVKSKTLKAVEQHNGHTAGVVISESIKYHFGRTRLILPLSETSTPGINPFVLGKEAKGGCCSVVFDGLRYYYLGKQE